jgi:hypothetical protein
MTTHRAGSIDDSVSTDDSVLLHPRDRDLLLTAATRAPSLHNTQPWTFTVEPQRILVHADPARQLPETDPTGRSLLISCGAALFNLRVAAAHLGTHPRIRLLPDPTDLTLVASVEIDHRHHNGPVGSLDQYFAQVPARRTNRAPFRDRRVPAEVIGRLAEAALMEGALLRITDDPVEIARVTWLVERGQSRDAADPARVSERAAWIGRLPADADGVPTDSLGPRPRGRALFRDLGSGLAIRREEARFEQTPAVAVLSTEHDRPVDWVRAGQALERVLLEATRAGVSASFLNAPLEHQSLRWLVRSPQMGVGHSQMLIRFGYGSPVPATPRRPLSEVLRVTS